LNTLQRQLRRLERRAPARTTEVELTDEEYLQSYEDVLNAILKTFGDHDKKRPPMTEQDKVHILRIRHRLAGVTDTQEICNIVFGKKAGSG
jgi:hypothetical protein